jgi:hypothetical protein
MTLIRKLSVMLMLFSLSGCGGGGGTIAIREVLGLATLSGTAAGGAAIVGTVQVTDSSTPPKTKGAPIDADGKYTVDVAGMTSPFILKASGTVGNTKVTYYSAAVLADVGNTVNVTPFTDIMVSNISAQMAQNCFVDMAHPCINLKDKLTPENLVKAQADLQAKLLPVLRNLGLSESIDLLRASFSTNHAGMDAVLDMVKVDVDLTTNIAVLKNGISGEEMGRVDPKTEVGRRDPVDSSKLTGINKEAVTDAQTIQTAIEGVAKMFTTSLPTPQQLADSGLFDVESFLDDGIKFAQFAEELSLNSQLIGLKFKNIHIEFDPKDKTIARVFFKMYDKFEAYHEDAEFLVEKKNGKWQSKGNQRIASIDINAHAEFNQSSPYFWSGISFWIDAFDYNSLVGDGEKAFKAIVSGPGLQLPDGTIKSLEMTESQYGTNFQNSFITECLPDSPLDAICLNFNQIKANAEYTVVLKNLNNVSLNGDGYKFKLSAAPVPTSKLTSDQFIHVTKILADGKLNALSAFKPGKSLTVLYANSKNNSPRGIFLNAWSTSSNQLHLRIEKRIDKPNDTSMLFAWDSNEPAFDVTNINISAYAKDEDRREFQTNFWMSPLNPYLPIPIDPPSELPIEPTPGLTTYLLGPDLLSSGFYILPSEVPEGWWSVDDDVTVYLNGKIIFEDKNKATDAFQPLNFEAKSGDQLRIAATDSAGTCHYLTPLKISIGNFNMPLSGTSIRQVCDYLAPSTTPFFDQTYTLP